MNSNDVINHVRGESIFVDDYRAPEGTLYASVFSSNIAHGKIKSIKLNDALKTEGVERIILAKDIPGVNQIGGIIEDESLLAEDSVHFIGEPIAVILAESKIAARLAREKIIVEFEELEIAVNAKEAAEKDLLIIPPKTFENGNVSDAWKNCKTIVEGIVESGGQEHLYLETQGALAIPHEREQIKIISSTQGPTSVQKVASNVLAIPMHKIEVDVGRLGGAFGGKEDQATVWAVLAALGTFITKKPVKLILPRGDDLNFTGKRHPYSSNFKIGLSKELKILAYEVTFYQDAGACADLSPAVLERTLFHATNSYFIPNVKATALSCKTNLPPNTAFRGFGGPQGKFVIEAAISKTANILNINANEIQKINLIKDDDYFYYGQKVKKSKSILSWETAISQYQFSKLENNVKNYNSENRMKKKGLAIMPICFGISFTNSFLNQASCLLHIYLDGSIGISTAAVEMGQGVNEKIKIIVSKILSIGTDKIKFESTNTSRNSNTSPTAASSGADLNGNAALKASKTLLKRLINFISKEFDVNKKNIIARNGDFYHNKNEFIISWEELIKMAYFKRVNLSCHAHYSTPKIHFDRTINKGRPFAYHVYGTSISGVTLDCIRGTYEIDFVKVVHDSGKTLHQSIDRGQIEGGIVQGIGWLTLEEVKYSDTGRLLSNTLSTYKIPDIYSIPKKIDINYLESSDNRFGPFKSKAVGEPPLMYGIGTYFALINAMKAFNKKLNFDVSAPLTPEKVLMNLHNK